MVSLRPIQPGRIPEIDTIPNNVKPSERKGRLKTDTLAASVTILLNLLLLPIWGLLGAVVATGLSTLLCLLLTMILNRRVGMHSANGTWLAILAPASLALGSVSAVVTLMVLIPSASLTRIISNDNEREEIKETALKIISKLPFPANRRWSTAGGL